MKSKADWEKGPNYVWNHNYNSNRLENILNIYAHEELPEERLRRQPSGWLNETTVLSTLYTTDKIYGFSNIIYINW